MNPGDPVGMEPEIINLLNNSQASEAEEQRGYKLVFKLHNTEQYVENLPKQLTQAYLHRLH